MSGDIKSTKFDYLNIDEDVFASIVQDFLNLAYVAFEEIRKEEIDLPKLAKMFCTTLFPYSKADAIAITDSKRVLSYVGYMSEKFPENCDIRTQATKEVLRDGVSRTLLTREEIGLADEESEINAAVIEAILINSKPVATMKLYYKNPESVTRSQHILAEALVTLISALLTSGSFDHQRELNRRMEIKMLQSQINPHFLFNTINTITSFVRTDPNKAREMLREFASFYRATLVQGSTFVSLSQELENSERYIKLEQARYGEEKLKFESNVDDGIPSDVRLPAMILQPIVENAVIHAMPANRCLTIQINVVQYFDHAKIDVIDDGLGMDRKTLNKVRKSVEVNNDSVFKLNSVNFEDFNENNLIDKKNGSLGMAMNNVAQRLYGCFGLASKVEIDSVVKQGTTVSFKIPLLK